MVAKLSADAELTGEICTCCEDDLQGLKAKAELGWEPGIDFKDGLRRTLDWFRAKWDA